MIKKLTPFLPPKEWGFLARAGVFLGIILIIGALFALGENIVNRVSEDQETQESEAPVALFDDIVHDAEVESLRGIEYFNSPAYSSLVDSGSVYADKLIKRIKEPNRKYVLPLLALRAVSKDTVYTQLSTRKKSGILIDALNEATYFNGWGFPHIYRSAVLNTQVSIESSLGSAVAAIIELGRPAIPVLGKLLFERRYAPVWGSDEPPMVSDYEVADYAVALIIEIEFALGIRDDEFVFPLDREGRDKLIKRYIEKYGFKQTSSGRLKVD